jgi:hypothetical protein
MTKLLLALILSLSGVVSVAVFAPPSWGGGDRGGSNGPGHMTAPEIDPSSAIAALTLLLGSVTVLRSRVAKK